MEKKYSSGLGIYWMFLLFVLLAGYVVYGDFRSVATLGLITILLGISTVVCLLPGIGIYLQHILSTKIINWLTTISSIQLTWVTSTIYWYYMIAGIVINLFVILVIVLVIYNKRNKKKSLKEIYNDILKKRK